MTVTILFKTSTNDGSNTYFDAEAEFATEEEAERFILDHDLFDTGFSIWLTEDLAQRRSQLTSIG